MFRSSQPRIHNEIGYYETVQYFSIEIFPLAISGRIMYFVTHYLQHQYSPLFTLVMIFFRINQHNPQISCSDSIGAQHQSKAWPTHYLFVIVFMFT